MKLTFTLFIFFTCFCPCYSQQIRIENIKNARLLITKKQYSEAEILLSHLVLKLPNDLESNWLYAEVLHWNNKNSKSEVYFEKALSISNEQTEVQIDYARMLYGIGKFKKAKKWLSNLVKKPETKVEALLMLSQIQYWEGNIKQAKETINTIQKLYPETDITNALTKNIEERTAVNLKTKFEYAEDTQPIKYIEEKIEISNYFSWALSPKLEIENYNYTPTQQALTANLGNQFDIYPIGLSVSIGGGMYKNFSQNTDWIASVDCKQKITKGIHLNIGYNKIPYLGTIESTRYNLTQNNLYGGINYESKKTVSLYAGYNYQFFDDDNSIESYSSWIVSIPFGFSNFKIQVGYGFSYSDSKNNLFAPTESVTEYLTNYDSNDTAIEGYYSPYFTPKNQIINSGLIILNYNLNKKIAFTLKTNYGFIAKAANPYFSLTEDSAGDITFLKNYYDANYHPYEISGTMAYQLSPSFEAKISYTKQESFFYNSKNINLKLNYFL